MRILILAALLFICNPANLFAQIRPTDQKPKDSAPAAAVKPAPERFEAKYEGGIFGYSKKEKGTLRFDDDSSRLIFYGKDKKEKFSIPYGSMLVVYPSSTSVTTTTGNVVSHVPLPGAGLASLIKKKRQYLVINFNDPDLEARGLVNFRLDNKELVESVIAAIAQKASLTKRGDAFYRPRNQQKTEIKEF